MYGMLFFDEARGVLATQTYFCQALKAPELLTPEVNARKAMVNRAIEAVCKDTAQQRRLIPLMENLCLLMDSTNMEFGVYMALAHHMLPDVERKAREARIEQLIQAHLPAPNNLPKTLTPPLDLLRQTAITVPDLMMETLVRAQCARLLSYFATQNEAPATCRFVSQMAGGVQMFLQALGDEVVAFTVRCLFLRPVTEVSPFLDRLAMLNQARKLPVLVNVCKLCNEHLPHTPPLASDVLMEIMKDILEQPTVDPVQIATEHVALMRRKDEISRDRVVRDTVAAVRRQVAMGEACTTAARNALRQQEAQLAQQTLRVTAERRKACPPLTTDAAPPDANKERGDLDPVHAWSVDRLLQWIEGPMTREPAKHHTDRKRILENEHQAAQRRREQQASANPSNAPKAKGLAQPPQEPDLTDTDINTVIMDGLATTAQYQFDSIVDLVRLANRLKAPKPQLSACEALLPALADLVKAPAKHEEVAARTLLGQTETAITQLRRSVQGAKADAALKNRFARQLGVALGNEELVYGKRHGGVISCALGPEDWAWVAERYHNRWLAGVQRLKVDGVMQAIPDDRALALYVTGSSQSRYAFDVTVHVWRRLPGFQSLPGMPAESGEEFAHMNTAEWEDTLVTCAVLHIPPGH